MKGDFHIHSTHSDGLLSVSQIIDYINNKLDYISITDHDTLKGSYEAFKQQSNVKIIIGVEVSTYYNNESIHVLAYFNNIEDSYIINDYLEVQRKNRINRAFNIAQKLYDIFKIDIDIAKLIDKESITRGSIANLIIDSGYHYSKEEIFLRMLGDNSPCYIPSTKVTLQEAIKKLKEANAFIVLAHPGLIKKSSYKDILKMGFDGIEAIYPAHTKQQQRNFIKEANKLNIVVTAGSDFHGFNDYKHGNLNEIYLEDDKLTQFINKMEKK